MSKLTEEQKAKGRKRFLDANPDVARKIAALTYKDAEFMCTTLEDLQNMETMKALGEYARVHGKDSHELFLSCVADTAEEFAKLNEARLQAIQRAIGL
jgi:hypothetical protein